MAFETWASSFTPSPSFRFWEFTSGIILLMSAAKKTELSPGNPDFKSAILKMFKNEKTKSKEVSWEHCLHKKKISLGASEWLSRLSVWLWLRLWSHGSWVRAHIGLLSAQSLLQILCPSLSGPTPLTCACCLSLKNKYTFKKNESISKCIKKDNTIKQRIYT